MDEIGFFGYSTPIELWIITTLFSVGRFVWASGKTIIDLVKRVKRASCKKLNALFDRRVEEAMERTMVKWAETEQSDDE